MTSLSLTALHQRALAQIGGISPYRLVLSGLGAIAAVAFVLSFFGLVAAEPLALVVSGAVLAAVALASDAVAHRILRTPPRWESSLVTAGILLFILPPRLELVALAGAALTALVASVSKYLIAWRGRHILNPAALGVGIVAATPLVEATWWVGTAPLSIVVALAGLVVAVRTEKLRVVLVFLLVGAAATVVRLALAADATGAEYDAFQAGATAIAASPLLFLGVFMLSEPLTLPPRRNQQFAVAAVVGVLAGAQLSFGAFLLGPEQALLLGNLLAFAFALRTAVRLRFAGREFVTPTVLELRFEAQGTLAFVPGQYLELEVPHRKPDARGTRREFSIVSTPQDLPTVRIAYRDGGQKHPSTFKKALAATEPGDTLPVTGVWGDFVLPRADVPIVLVAAGIGVTPFVSQLRSAWQSGKARNAVLVYVAAEAAELAYRAELEETGAEVIVFTRDAPAGLPENWHWAQGVRLDAAGLARVVPDLAERHAYVSGPPRLIADLAPALQKARSLTTDAFAGY